MKTDLLAGDGPRDETEIAALGAQIRNLIDDVTLGVLSTIDSKGVPQLRWMATTTFESFPHIYTLTSPHSRKMDHVAINPWVSWMFASEDMKFVVNLTGQARVLLQDVETMKKIWNQISDKSRAYFLGDCVSGPGFSVLETVVEHIECTFPVEGRRVSLAPEWIRKAWDSSPSVQSKGGNVG